MYSGQPTPKQVNFVIAMFRNVDFKGLSTYDLRNMTEMDIDLIRAIIRILWKEGRIKPVNVQENSAVSLQLKYQLSDNPLKRLKYEVGGNNLKPEYVSVSSFISEYPKKEQDAVEGTFNEAFRNGLLSKIPRKLVKNKYSQNVWYFYKKEDLVKILQNPVISDEEIPEEPEKTEPVIPVKKSKLSFGIRKFLCNIKKLGRKHPKPAEQTKERKNITISQSGVDIIPF